MANQRMRKTCYDVRKKTLQVEVSRSLSFEVRPVWFRETSTALSTVW
jgi:hypothetical protein